MWVNSFGEAKEHVKIKSERLSGRNTPDLPEPTQFLDESEILRIKE